MSNRRHQPCGGLHLEECHLLDEHKREIHSRLLSSSSAPLRLADNEIRGIYRERFGELFKNVIIEPTISFALDTDHRLSADACPIGKLFLRPALCLAKLGDT